MKIIIGNGFDVHAFAEGRDLILGGVKIPFEKGLAGHSDADVLTHAIIDSILSPCGCGDIGQMFPDSDNQYKDISSIYLLTIAYKKVKEAGYRIINSDSVIACEKPKILPYVDSMKQILSDAFSNEVPPESIGIKGKTTEKLGFIGRGEGIAVWTVTLLERVS